MLSRRDVVGKLAAGTAVACVVGVAATSRAAVRGGRDGRTDGPTDADASGEAQVGSFQRDVIDAGPPATASAPAPWELIRPLTVGSAVAHGWRVSELSGAVDGSCVLTLASESGRSHRIHICRNDGDPQGLVYTKRFDLVVMNGGQGDLRTDEGLARAVAEVAHVLAANEDGSPVVTALLPHAERLRLYAGPLNRSLR